MAAHRAKSGGRAPKDKGNREEQLLVNFLQRHGFGAERIPLSGACGGRFGSDISLPLLGVDRKIEVKVRERGFEMLYRWLGVNSDMLIVRRNRRDALVIIPLKLAVTIAVAAEKSKLNSKFPEAENLAKTAAPPASETADQWPHGQT